MNFKINHNIASAETIHTDFYQSTAVFEKSKESIFAKSWLYAADATVIKDNGQVHPTTLLKHVLDEPIVLTRDKSGKAHCLSNVCTHRGKIIAEESDNKQMLSCGYHGRCFHLDGRYKSMPGFDDVENFPRPEDNLHKIAMEEALGMLFVNLDPSVSFAEIIKPITDRLSWLPFDTLKYVDDKSTDYLVNGHWALYCDNYLEGFHVPFVHAGLNEALAFDEYDYEIYPYCNLQLGVAKEGEPCFDIPNSSSDHGKNIYAYYYWVWPNMMFNIYPWGLSLNLIEPLGPDLTLVKFRTYQFEGTEFDWTANQIDITELEDEAVVESVQEGIKSRFYTTGRYSASMEKCVHHFHQLLAKAVEV
jgi:choline monooxygenase